jgi:hypothetical protein
MGAMAGDANMPKASLSMGGGKNATVLHFPMVDVSGGGQRDRMQVDVTLAGSLNITGGVNNGVGNYTMTFMDGPILDAEKILGVKKDAKVKTTAVEQFLSAKLLTDRQMSVKLFSPQVTCDKKAATSKPIAVFHGIAVSIDISLTDTGEMLFITSKINAVGKWDTQ